MAFNRKKCLKIINANDFEITVYLGPSVVDGTQYNFTLNENDTGWQNDSIKIPARGFAFCKGLGPPSDGTNSTGFKFSAAGKIILNGSLTSLLDGGAGGSDTTLPTGCFNGLFDRSNNNGIQMTYILRKDLLPSLTVPDNGYKNLFQGQKIPSLPRSFLPATSVGKYSYKGMFSNVNDLTSVPNLFPDLFTTLDEDCFSDMFNGCSQLEEIFLHTFNNWPYSTVDNKELFTNWVKNVSASGVFHCNPSLPISYSNNRVPTGWSTDSKTSHINTGNCFKITNVGSTAINLEMNNSDWGDEYYFVSEDDLDTLHKGSYSNLPVGAHVYCLGTGASGRSTDGSTLFKCSAAGVGLARADFSGSIMSLIDDGAGELLDFDMDQSFYKLFRLTNVKSFSEEFLPATGLSPHCYDNLFFKTQIAAIPENCLPATELAPYCYGGMFGSLPITEIPGGLLPATTLAKSCYEDMFAYSSALKTVPAGLLPATNGAENCYRRMFYQCTALEEVEPESIKMTNFAFSCMSNMFEDCSNLKRITVGFSDWGESLGAGMPTRDWVKNVASKGSFYGPSALARTYDDSHIPFGWEPPTRGSMIFNRKLKAVIG